MNIVITNIEGKEKEEIRPIDPLNKKVKITSLSIEEREIFANLIKEKLKKEIEN